MATIIDYFGRPYRVDRYYRVERAGQALCERVVAVSMSGVGGQVHFERNQLTGAWHELGPLHPDALPARWSLAVYGPLGG